MKKVKPLLVIAFTVILFFLPILISPNLFLERNNDLQEVFWPVFYFIRENFLTHKELPFWNNLFFSGTPILPDPQFSLYYPLNSLFLILSTNLAFVANATLHTFIGSIGMYLLAKKGFKLSNLASMFAAILYIFAPKNAAYLEAGHYGLIGAHAWLPYIFLSLIKLINKPKFVWSILFAVGLAGTFFNHSLIFASALALSIIIFIFQKKKLKSGKYVVYGIIILFGLTAITLLPQLEWSPTTTRYLLLENPEVYPKWLTKREFLTFVFTPWINGIETMQNISTEKWLTVGILPLFLAFFGLISLKKKYRFIILFTFLSVFVLALNNLNPLYQILINIKYFSLIRVATRFWYIFYLPIIILSGFGLDYLIKRKINKKFVYLLAIFALVESLTLSWIYLKKPIKVNEKFASKEVYELIGKDKSRFRVFCLNRCLSQKEAVKYNLELAEGYNTLQQDNYYQHSIQLTQTYFDRYSLALPPFEIYNFVNIQPHAATLGNLNIKYVISPHTLTDTSFKLLEKIDHYYVYENLLSKPRAYSFLTKGYEELPIINYSPNKIRVDTSKSISKLIILAEVYSPGWRAFLNGKKEASVLEHTKIMRSVEIKSDTKFVDFIYLPQTYKWGKIITSSTIIILLLLIFKKENK